ncbi:hypothetical protein C7293_12700 [filamentous cyanobacterium CCT1]|nr:hypothetical protein C7293_12700 [filamentous cyanobacterium CCT1]PSN80542.1 hypothetical protein C8B47_05980 [filamentous cyanobacterium CCP4]
MWKQLNKLWSKHPALMTGVGFSLLLLVLFLLAQQFEVKALTLEIQWIAISILPLVLALLAGGYVQSFKGFGVELEARLENTSVTSIEFSATVKESITTPTSVQKGGIDHLEQLRGQRIDRLAFIEGRSGYYDPVAVKEYLEKLTRLKYVEVQSSTREFRCLLPIKLFVESDSRPPDGMRQVKRDAIERFIQSLEEGNVLTEFAQSAITLTVLETESLVKALKTMRSHHAREAAVISSDRQCIGLLSAWKIEKRIADEVLRLSK